MKTRRSLTITLVNFCLLLGFTGLSTYTAADQTKTENKGSSKAFMISEAQFEALFPKRIPFYTYAGLLEAMSAYPAFGNTGSDVQKKQEVAAFLANIMHESDQLRAVTEYDTTTHDKYCNDKEGVPCAPGKQYYGRGPIQLSWNFNYVLAGKALGLDLWGDPDMVARVPAVAWKTALWYWMEIKGPAPIPAHESMTKGLGFGETVRSINGILECGKAPDNIGYQQQQERIQNYLKITKMLGVKPGKHSSCV